ncbi:MAG: family 43 glycosylhydrolase [Prevotella sp.]|nr:family 43 glycosylhydrolase [Prevotella sp.]
MKLKIILGTVFMCVSMGVEAQTISRTYKTVSNGNPISPCVFCADPTALEYDGRLYVYGSNDSQQFVVNNKQGNNGYGAIKSLVVFSTDDMVNWTFHGTIDVGKLCSSWGWRFAASWAPSVTWRVGANGKDEFFLYFANSGGSVGVLTANSPIGPWKSPLSKPLIDGDTPGVAPCNWIFDPGVVIDDNGTGWIAFGGGDPNSQGTKLMPGNSRIAKLKSSMIALDGKAVNLPAPYLFEASELNMMNGRYVYTYNTSWSDRNDWNSYAKRGSYPSPSSCSMCYMVTDDPLNPNAWEYKGEYVPNPGNFGFGWGNNHTHLQKFQGNYYLFYHSMVLEQNMNTGASGFRSIGVEKVTVNESKQQINKVTMTNQGPAAIKKMDPYSLQQAETMSTSGGINYEDFSNIVKVTTLNGLGNDASKNLQVKMNKGAWTMVRNVDFGSEGANSFTLRTKGTGKLEIRLDNPNAKAAATVEFSSSVFLNHTVSVDPTLFKGVKKIFFMFMESTNVYFDSWQFSLEQPSGIQPFVSAEKTPSAVYDLSGRKHLSNQGLKSGVYIRDGKKVVVK